MKLRIKKEYFETRIGYNGSGLPLGCRDDHEVLAEIAIKTNDTRLLGLFEEIPSKEKIKEMKGTSFVQEQEKGK